MKKNLLFTGLVLIAGTTLWMVLNQPSDISNKNPYQAEFDKYQKVKGLSYEEIKKLPKQDRPDLALLQEYEITKDLKLGYPPTTRKVTAFKQAKLKLAARSNARGIENVEWEERGPNNVGGRTRALMFDPTDDTNKKVWAASVSGGIWYNNDITDASSQWINVDDFMANLSVSTLAYDPATPSTFYAGTGEYWTGDFKGTGIWKSVDSGASWNQLGNTEGFGYTNKIVVTSNSVIVAATSSGIKISSDGGNNWSSPSNVTDEMSDVELDASEGLLICAGFSGDIYKSSDNGSTWSSISPGLGGQRVEVAFAPSNNDLIYAVGVIGVNVGWMAKSTNGGSTWTEINIPKYLEQGSCAAGSFDFSREQAWYDLILAVNPSDANEVIVGGIDLHKSTDAGTNWSPISYWTEGCAPLPYVHADQHAIVFKPGSSSEAIFGNDGGVYYSSDINATEPDFAARNNNYNVTQFYAVAINNTTNSNEMLAGSQDNGTQKFSEFGIGSTEEATGGDGAYCFIDQDDPSIQITSYVYNNYYISRDGGSSFQSFGLGNEGGFINQTDYDSDANILYARADAFNTINRYTINASSITTAEVNVQIGGVVSHILASPFEDNVLYVGTSSGTVNKVTQSNTSAPESTRLLNLPGTVTSIDLANNGSTILVTFGNYGAQSVWYSDDAGANWIDIEGNLPDMPVWWGMFNPKNPKEVLLATEVGVWSSDDITTENVEWDPTNEGLANVSSRMLQYREADGLFVVATHGRGVFTSSSFSGGLLADFSASSYIGYLNKEMSFYNQSRGEVTSTAWTISDGSTYSSNDINHTFTTSGWHTVQFTLNDSLKKTRKIFILPKRPDNYVCELENEPNDTYADNVKGNIGFELGNSTIEGKDGVVSGDNAWVLGLKDSQYANGSTTNIYFPEFDFSTAGSYELSFYVNYEFEDTWDGFIIEYSTDRGDTWNKLGNAVETDWYNQTSDTESVFGNAVPIFSGSTGGDFVQKKKDVSEFAGESSVTFRLVYMSDAFTVDVGMALDDIKLTGPSSDLTPNFSVNYQDEYCSGNSVTFYNNSSLGATSYSWSFGSGASPSTADGAGPHEVTYTTSGAKTVALTIDGPTTETKVSFITVKESMTNGATFSLAESSVCKGSDAEIVVSSSETGKAYQVFADGSENPYTEAVSGTGGKLSIFLSNIEKDTDFYVEISKAGACSEYSDVFAVDVISTITESSYSDQTPEVCEGQPVSVRLNSSQSGVSYQLINAADGSLTGEAVNGTGNSITLASDALTEDIQIGVTATDSNNGCELTFSNQVEVTILPSPDLTLTQTDFILEVSDVGETYAWFKNGSAISGATSNSFEVTENGIYHVAVESGECEFLSESKTVIVAEADNEILPSIYPNPSNGIINFDLASNLKAVKVYSLSGELVYSYQNQMNEIRQIDISRLETGVYILETVNSIQSKRQKIILKK